MFTRILVGDDGGAEGLDAVVLGEALATATGAGLTLLQAFAPTFLPSPAGIDEETSRHAAHELAADRSHYAPHALTEVVADFSAARALGRHAHRWHADVVVIGSSRRAESGRVAIGKVGRGLLERAPYAVAIAKRGLHEQGFQINSVAVGYDGGAQAQIALGFADAIAAGAGAELLILTVAHDEQPACAETAARTRVQAHDGDPGNRLRELSDSVDLMVIGSRRWGPIARLVLGGVGETLASDCGASLLISRRELRHPAHSAAQTTDQIESKP